jgi:hypothetical protein
MLRAQLRQSAEANVKDKDGTLQTVYHSLFGTIRVYAIKDYPADGNQNLGVVVGTDDTAPTPTDYKLVTQIAHGTGAGQLQYGGNSVVVNTTATKSQMSITRTFTNGSGASITVKEVGLYLLNYNGTGESYFCVIRSLNNFTVPDGESRTVEILLEATA